MARQELYAWASLGSSLALAGLYVLLFVGIPSVFDAVADNAMGLFLAIVGLSFVIEFLLDLGSGLARVDADERDRMIAGRAYRLGFHAFTVAFVILIGHLFIVDYLTAAGGADPYAERMPGFVRHFVVLSFLAANLVKSGTQVFLYGRSL